MISERTPSEARRDTRSLLSVGTPCLVSRWSRDIVSRFSRFINDINTETCLGTLFCACLGDSVNKIVSRRMSRSILALSYAARAYL